MGVIAYKVCGWCGKQKPLDQFRKDSRRRDGRRNECRSCRRDYDRNYKRDHPQAGRVRNSERTKDNGLRSNYGITLVEFRAMIDRQHGKCAICGGDFDEEVYMLVPCVDHDHETGKVRGILHRNCNAGIGLLQDSPEILLSAAMYLRSA